MSCSATERKTFSGPASDGSEIVLTFRSDPGVASFLRVVELLNVNGIPPHAAFMIFTPEGGATCTRLCFGKRTSAHRLATVIRKIAQIPGVRDIRDSRDS